MRKLQSRVVLDGLAYPEGIRWHAGKIWFSDVLDFRVLSWEPHTGHKTVVAQLQDKPSGLGFLPDGKLVIVAMGERQLLRLDTDGLRVVADLKRVCGEQHHLNDMVIDGKGRAYVGALDNGDHSQREGRILLVEPDGSYQIAADDLSAPNGMAITSDGRTLFACDTSDRRIVIFDIENTGLLTNRRTFADLGDARPDGVCLDAEGAAWVGLPFKGEFCRIRQGGQVTHRVPYEDRLAVAPVFGGVDRRTLYLCTSHRMPLPELIALLRTPHRVADAHRVCKGAIEMIEGITIAGSGWP